MPDRFGEPWSGTTYNGFSGTGPAAPGAQVPPPEREGLRIERPPPRRFEPDEYRRVSHRRGPRRGLVLGGLAAAIGLGAVLGLVARPDLGLERAPRAPMPAVTAALPEATAPVPIEVAQPTPAPAPKGGEPLEVLPPEMADAARANAPVAAGRAPPREVAEAPRGSDVAARAPELPRAAPVVREPEPAPREFATREPAPAISAPAVRPSFNCRYARSQSERMVCDDPQLAALDRRLNRAFQQAVASGMPYRDLRAEQDDWLRIREDAARRAGPEAVESVYRQRIRELTEMSELAARF